MRQKREIRAASPPTGEGGAEEAPQKTGSQGASKEGGGDPETPKRRSRGRRGGRRRRGASRSGASAEGAAGAAKDEKAPADAGPGEQTSSGPSGKKTKDAPEGDAKKPSRRPRRRRRRKPASADATSGTAVAGGMPLVGTGAAKQPASTDAGRDDRRKAADEDRQGSADGGGGKAGDDDRKKKAKDGGGKATHKNRAEDAAVGAKPEAGDRDTAGDDTPAGDGGGEPGKRKGRSRAKRPAPGAKDKQSDEGRSGGTSARERSEPADAPRARRRSRTATRPSGPAAERVVLASEDLGELRVAVIEDERLAAVYLERTERPSILGNIYRGRVQNVLKGMDASFVDFGLEKAGFLHVDEVTSPDDSTPRRSRRITQLLKAGQELTVQVTKDPMKGKGARLSTKISLPGRYLVYVPGGSGVGVSRRLPQEERDRLRDLCKKLRPRKAGLIVRTVAEGKDLEDLRRDLQYLSRLWSRLKKKAEGATAPSLVHEEVDVALSAARDLVDETCTKFVIDAPKVRKRVVGYLERVAPDLAGLVEEYKGERPLFEKYGVEDAIDATLSRRAPLPSGGNLVIDPTEALTVVDVNSGKFTGGKRLEDTITRTNLEAAEELVRQLRLRDIGGIIVIDFIDMARRENREAVLAKLEDCLSRDKTKTYVVEISPLGLVEMTRQGTTEGTRALMTMTCPTCHGTSRVLSPDTMARDAERMLDRQLPGTPGEAVLVEVQRAVADRLVDSERAERLERRYGKRLVFDGSQELPVDTLRIVAGGTVQEIEAQKLPVREGEELDVELRHALPYSPRDAVAVTDGYQLVVKGGRQHLGRTRRVKVETAQRHGGVATLV